MHTTACVVDITRHLEQCANYTIVKSLNLTPFLALKFNNQYQYISFLLTCNPIIHCLKAYWLLITVVATVAMMIRTV